MLPDSRHAAMTLGEQILPMVRDHDRFTVIEEILGARIPILKLCFDNTLDIDLSCHNPTPLLNTRLLKAYSQMDIRVRDLGIAIKHWAKGAGLCDAIKSNLSSYSFTLLVLYFMQVHMDVQLPALPTEEMAALSEQEACQRATIAASSWYCQLSLTELMSRFFAFYSSESADDFHWGSEVASIRCGSRRPIHDSIFANLRGRHARRIHIEDPYQTERNLHAVLGEVEEETLRAAFREASHAMKTRLAPRALPHQSLPQFVPGNPALLSQVSSKASEQALKSHLFEPVQSWNVRAALDSGTDSTPSFRTLPAVTSDSDSDDDGSVESSCGPNAANIPLPQTLLMRSTWSF